jgi:competence protein ComFC
MLIRSLVELLTPEDCLGCGADAVVFCTTCVKSFGLAKANECFSCRKPSPAGLTCKRCRPDTALAGMAVGAFYDGAVKELILKLKFHRLRSAEDAAASLVLGALPGSWGAQMVTSVPISASRYRERGYNQSELIARRVAARLALPYAPLLGRATSVHQLGVGRQTRFEQVRGAFYLARGCAGARVLIVDDVVTTGATLSECAAVLSGAGAREVWGAAVARH